LKITRYISQHPFVFLLSLLLISSCFMGNLLKQIGSAKNNQTDLPISNTSTFTLAEPIDTVAFQPSIIQTPIFIQTDTAVLTETLSSLEPGATTTNNTVEYNGPLVITFVDVGQGDSILFKAPDGEIGLLDGGSTDTGIVSFLQQSGVTSIDLMIASHPHEDHIGGLVQVLEMIPVKSVVTNGQAYTTTVFEHFLDAIIAAKAEYSEAARGASIPFGDLAFDVLSPVGINEDDPNTSSLVLRLTYMNTTVLFMGDADSAAEGDILAAGLPVKADILKVAHHGSCTALNREFLDAVMPTVAVYSAGRNNQYNLPCVATIYALQQRNALILGTDVDGSITVTITSDGYTITDSNGKTWR
jgi:competence protein ComEC